MKTAEEAAQESAEDVDERMLNTVLNLFNDMHASAAERSTAYDVEKFARDIVGLWKASLLTREREVLERAAKVANDMRTLDIKNKEEAARFGMEKERFAFEFAEVTSERIARLIRSLSTPQDDNDRLMAVEDGHS